jgi:superfamily II DNA or RNA helicase
MVAIAAPAIRARVDSCIHLPSAEVPEDLFLALDDALSFANPVWIQRKRLGKSVRWTVEKIHLLAAGDDLRLPRGAVRLVLRLAREHGVDIHLEDARTDPGMVLPELPRPALRPYQEHALGELVVRTQGHVVIPCGGGKTRVGLGAIAELRASTVILVHTLDLAEQWLREIALILGVNAGLVGGGTYDPGPVTVAVIQALERWDVGKLDAFLAGFGFLILDEAHHVAATTFRDVVHRHPGRFRLGLTATPEREDGLSAFLELYLGRRLAEVSHEDLVTLGVLTLPEIREVKTSFRFDYRSTEDWQRLCAALIADPDRLTLIADTVAYEAQRHQTCLVLSARVDHCQAIAGALTARGVDAAVLTGDVPKAKRAELLEQARTGRLRVLVATSLADEGLDLPRLARVFLAFPSRAQGRTMQRLGRLMRPHPEKGTPVLFDFVDPVSILKSQWRARRKLYRTLGVA